MKAILIMLLLLTLAVSTLARHPVLDWMEGLVQRVEPQFRELSILDYQRGTST